MQSPESCSLLNGERAFWAGRNGTPGRLAQFLWRLSEQEFAMP